MDEFTVSADPVSGASGEPARMSTATAVLDGSVALRDESGRLLAYQAPIPEDVVAPLRAAVRSVKYGRLARPGGMASLSRTFGFAPRTPVRGYDSCRAAVLASENPPASAVLATAAGWLAQDLGRHNPAALDELWAHAADICPTWRFPSAPWTSGIINRTSELRLHRDGANTPTWSVMPVYRHRCTGGALYLPEFDVAFACPDAHYLAFPGSGILHGVTPLEPRTAASYRYSAVFYQLAGMKKCLPPSEELLHAQHARTEREKLYALLEAGDQEAAVEVASRLGLTVDELQAGRHRAP